jgi:hypothetical protein
MKRYRLALASCALLALTSCASDFSSYQQITVQTAANNAPLAGAQCFLSNSKGNWMVITPYTTSVHRGSEALSVMCVKPGYASVSEMVHSSVNAGAILVAGAMYSTVSGSAWDYPPTITIPMQPAAAN